MWFALRWFDLTPLREKRGSHGSLHQKHHWAQRLRGGSLRFERAGSSENLQDRRGAPDEGAGELSKVSNGDGGVYHEV